jgi:hypothetical protein
MWRTFWICVYLKEYDVALMMETVNSSETSVNIYQTTRRNVLEYSHYHTRRRENLKSHPVSYLKL